MLFWPFSELKIINTNQNYLEPTRIPPFEEGYCEEYITDILPIHHWQTTDILPTVDCEAAIDTSTDIKRMVIASIDRHSIECQRKLKVCRLRCRMCVNRGSTECRPRVNRDVDRVSIAGRSRCWSPVSIDTRSRVSIVHMIHFLFVLLWPFWI